CGADSADSIDDGALTSPPPLRPLDGVSGTGIKNGLKPSTFMPLRGQLLPLLNLPLSVNGQLNPEIKSSSLLMGGPDGDKVLTYAVECALPGGTTVDKYVGAGMMATTASWLNAPLSPLQQNDVLTCIMTRLNPSGTTVN